MGFWRPSLPSQKFLSTYAATKGTELLAHCAVEVPTGNGLLESTTERSLSLDSNLEGLAASWGTVRTFEACFALPTLGYLGSSHRLMRELKGYTYLNLPYHRPFWVCPC